MGRALLQQRFLHFLSNLLEAIQVQDLVIQGKVYAAKLTYRHRFIRYRQPSLVTNCSHSIHWMANNVIEYHYRYRTDRDSFPELLCNGLHRE